MRLNSLLTALFVVLALAGPTGAQPARPAPAAPTTVQGKWRAWEQHQALDRASLFHGLEWRNIGPVVMGGRIVDIESVPGEPYTFYVAYASAGVWKTVNNGVSFEPLFDDQPGLIVGDIAVAPSQPQTIWVGTGENNSSRSSYGGLGMFRSDDGGASWSHRGLDGTDRIGRVLIDPRNPDRVLVGAIGKLYTKGGDRGIFLTEDGGANWTHVLNTAADDDETGVIDMVLDPSNPDVVYAAAWQRSRRPWDFVEGGNGSAVYKSTDAGKSWRKLGGGLPSGENVGRIGLAISKSNPSTLYVSIDNQELLPESEWELGDAPVTAKRIRKMSKADFLAQDPEAIEDFIRGNDLDTSLDAAKLIEMIESDELTLDALLDELDDANANLFNTDIRGLEVYRSDDAGASWKRTHREPIREVAYTYGYYFGQIRVAPDNPDRVFCLGVPAIVSEDGGKSWSGMNGRGVHVDHHELWMDDNFPERMILGNDGGLDISYDGGATWLKMDRQPVGQFYTVHVDMEDPYNVYGGLQDNGTLKGSSQSRPALDEWSFVGGGDGMYVQTDSRDGTLYTGFQFGYYFRSGPAGRATVRPRDKLGEPALRYNWSTPILLSPHNEDVLYFGANRLYRSLDQGTSWTPISDDLTAATERGDVPFGTITSLSESPLQFGLIWAGTDDGQVQVSGDGGVSWSNVSAGLPRDRWVTRVEASRFELDRAYVSLNGYRDDDAVAYIYLTEDRGASWKSMVGLPAEPVNVIREDPVNADVLYVGTDRGVYVSLDRGGTWQGLPSGLPNVPVHDLVVHPRERELVIGTHGRSVYILDALPIQELDAETQQSDVAIFPVEDQSYSRGWQGRRSRWFHRPEDAPEIHVPFWSKVDGNATLTVLDADERPLRRLEMEVRRGVNRFDWDLLLDEPIALAAEKAAQKKDDGSKKRKQPKRKKDRDKTAADASKDKGKLTQTPWAEAVRLGWPLYVTPGDYTLRVKVGEAAAETAFKVTAPTPRTPRQQPEPKIRGQKDD